MHRPDILLALAGISVGLFVVASMVIDSAVLQWAASFAIIAIAALYPPAGLVALAFIGPLARPLVLPQPGLFLVVLAAMLFGVILRLPVERPRLRWPSVEVILLGAFLVYVATQVLGAMIAGSGGQSAVAITGVFARLAEVVLTFAVAYVVLRGRSPYPVLAALLLSALLGSLVALSQVFGFEAAVGGLIRPAEIVGRITGTFSDPNYFGVYLAVMITLAVACATLARSRPLKVALLALALPLSITLMYTQSRGALVALVAGLVALAFTRSRRAGFTVMATLLVVSVVAYPAFSSWRFGEVDSARGALSAESLTSGRVGAWTEGGELFLSSPFFGVGFGQFKNEASVGIGAHNWYVQVLAELGLTGVMIWSLFIVAVALALRRTPRPAQVIGYSVLATWLVAGVSLSTPTSYDVTGPLLIIVAAAVVADWAPKSRETALVVSERANADSRSGATPRGARGANARRQGE